MNTMRPRSSKSAWSTAAVIIAIVAVGVVVAGLLHNPQPDAITIPGCDEVTQPEDLHRVNFAYVPNGSYDNADYPWFSRAKAAAMSDALAGALPRGATVEPDSMGPSLVFGPISSSPGRHLRRRHQRKWIPVDGQRRGWPDGHCEQVRSAPRPVFRRLRRRAPHPGRRNRRRYFWRREEQTRSGIRTGRQSDRCLFGWTTHGRAIDGHRDCTGFESERPSTLLIGASKTITGVLGPSSCARSSADPHGRFARPVYDRQT